MDTLPKEDLAFVLEYISSQCKGVHVECSKNAFFPKIGLFAEEVAVGFLFIMSADKKKCRKSLKT